jgi:membrane fusion protein (multidrug efflux system)
VVTAGKRRGKPVLMVLAAVVVIGAIVATFYAIHAAQFVETDDAYIEGHVITISPQISAAVKTVLVDDNAVVHKGDVIVQLDPSDYQVALDQARATQAAMAGKLQQAKSEIDSAKASVDEARAEVDVAQANSENADADYKRFMNLSTSNAGAVSRQQMDSASAAKRSNDAQVEQAKAKLIAAQVEVETKQATELAADGDLQKAIADVHKAEVNLSYCTIRAPSDGKITRKSVEPGSYVQTGEQLLALVPDQVWVVANYKETQLEKMKPGQPVSITVDAYPGEELHGHLDSIQSGTGSRFSMLPAENATGNFVKVVQRIPVKILIDNPDRPLSPGMSVVVEVDVR